MNKQAKSSLKSPSQLKPGQKLKPKTFIKRSITTTRLKPKASQTSSKLATTPPFSSQSAPFIINPTCSAEHRREAANDLRKSQLDWMKMRVRRPFYTGLSSNGLNYIDTRPTDSMNMGTIDGEATYTPSPDNPHQTPLPKHTLLSNRPQITSPHTQSEQGITVVFAHGFSFGYGMWSENFDAVSSLPNVNRVIAFDWRGMGGSQRHEDYGPIRSSASVLEEYKHDTFVMALKEEKMAENNKKTKHMKSKQCKAHFKQYFSQKNQRSDNSDENEQNDPTPSPIPSHSAQSTSGDAVLPRHKRYINKVIRKKIYQAEHSFTPQRSIDYFIDPLLQLFKELDVTSQPVIIVGHSLGGYLSSNFIHKYPGLIQSIVLASPVGVSESYGLNHPYELESFQQYAISGIKKEELIAEQLDQLNAILNSHDVNHHSPANTQNNDPSNPNIHPSSPISPNPHHPFPPSTHKNPFFPTPQSLQIPSPSSPSSHSTDNSTATSSTALSVSTQRLTRPLILRNPIIQLIDFLWKTNSTPQSLLRALPRRFGYQVSTSLASRMHPPGLLGAKDEEVLINYLHKIFTSPPVGEHALNSLLHIDYPSHRAKSEWKQYKKVVKEHYAKVLQEQEANAADPAVSTDKSESQIENLGRTPQSKSLLEKEDEKYRSKSTQPRAANRNQSTSSPYDISSSDSEDDIQFSTTQSTTGQDQDAQGKSSSKKSASPVLPSVFARKPLTDILYDVNIPIHFLFGSHDWLFHADVPYIIGSLHEHFKHPHIMDFVNHKSIQTAFPMGVDTSAETNALDKTTPPSRDKTHPHQHTQSPHHHNTQFSNESTAVLVDQLNLRPEITLTVLPQSGHHLYVNNVDAFNLSLQNSFAEYVNKTLLDNKKKYGKEFNPIYSSTALSHYHAEYQQFLQLEAQRAKDRQCAEQLKRKQEIVVNHGKNVFEKSITTVKQHFGYFFPRNNNGENLGNVNSHSLAGHFIENGPFSNQTVGFPHSNASLNLPITPLALTLTSTPHTDNDNPESTLLHSKQNNHTQPLQFATSKCPVQRFRFKSQQIMNSDLAMGLGMNKMDGKNTLQVQNNDDFLATQKEFEIQAGFTSPLEHVVSSSLLSQETTIPRGTLKSHVCKYAQFIYSTKQFKYDGVSNTHFDRFHKFAKSAVAFTKSTKPAQKNLIKTNRDK